MDINAFRALCPPFEFFYQISQIPRASGDEQAIGSYLKRLAGQWGLPVRQDSHGNLCIRKPGQGGGETKPPVILQAHMDMVYVQGPHASRQYHQPLELICEDGILSARDSSLGADNGMGMAYILAVLAADSLAHPPITALFTTGEEDGLIGAAHLEAGFLAGERLLNLDGEVQCALTAGCAGGIGGHIALELERRAPVEGHTGLEVTLTGGRGGHSGLQIHLGRANPIRLLVRLLERVGEMASLAVEDLSGGSAMNVIPSQASVRIRFHPSGEREIRRQLEEEFALISREYRMQDPDLKLLIRRVSGAGTGDLTEDCRRRVAALIQLLPHGVLAMDPQVEGLVQTSNNLGVAAMDGQRLTLDFHLRSSLDSQKYAISRQIQLLCHLTGAQYTVRSDYPGWAYRAQSPLRELCRETYQALFRQEPRIEAVHAGLECGHFVQRRPDLDVVSIGPDLFDVHSVGEHVSVRSARQVWTWIQTMLSQMCR